MIFLDGSAVFRHADFKIPLGLPSEKGGGIFSEVSKGQPNGSI
jgi:hypothetical protein